MEKIANVPIDSTREVMYLPDHIKGTFISSIMLYYLNGQMPRVLDELPVGILAKTVNQCLPSGQHDGLTNSAVSPL